MVEQHDVVYPMVPAGASSCPEVTVTVEDGSGLG